MSDLLTHLKRQFQYDHWANGETLRLLERAAEPPEKAIGLLAHVIGAEYVWLDRLQGQPPSMEVWPRMQLGEMTRHLQGLRDRWAAYLDTAVLTAAVGYKNSKGEQFSNAVQDILSHVVNHGTYHRGQIAAVMRVAGAEPPYTDWIHAARRGHI